MKRTLFLFILFAVLGSGTVWFLTSDKTNQKTTVADWDRKFKVENTNDIHKIFLASRYGETVTLERKDGVWYYNGKDKVRPSAMENLMRAFGEMEMKYKPAQPAVPTMVKNLAATGIKVELYNKAGQNLKTYYIGGATPDGTGTYMIMEGSEQPYVVHLPTWEGNLRVRFDMWGDDWRDKTVFSASIDDIRSVTVEYPKQQNKSFRLEKTESGYTVRPFYDFTPAINKSLRPGAVEAYLMNFKSVGAEAFENDNPRQDSVRQLVPFSVVTIKTINGTEKQARFFPILPESGGVDEKTGAAVKTSAEVERFFVDVNDGEDFMLAQQRVFGSLFWAYDSFFTGDGGK